MLCRSKFFFVSLVRLRAAHPARAGTVLVLWHLLTSGLHCPRLSREPQKFDRLVLLVSYRPLAAPSSRTLKTASNRRNAAPCTRDVAAMTAARFGQRLGCLSGCWEKLINGREQ